MLDFTPLARPYFGWHYRRLASVVSVGDTERVQRRVLASILKRGVRTDYGIRHGFDEVRGAEDYASAVPVVGYEDIRGDVMRMVGGEADVLWPGVCRRYAQSSGTSGGKSKFIPLTAESFAHNHYLGAKYTVAAYLAHHPHSRLMGGKGFILGGSYANELDGLPRGVKVGDLSASLIDKINPAVNLMRIPGKDVALMADWHEKLPLLAAASVRENVTSISGVPSWFMTVLRKVMELAGADNIHQVWPNLEVFFHGGIAFGPYREQYREICGPEMAYQENYNSSEGFFAVEDVPGSGVMRLLTDAGVFYEFIPVDELDQAEPQTHFAWELEQGRTYALVITGENGLWRYMIGDTVRIESLEPLTITIAGRTKSFINAFGEELMVWNADAAIAAACRQTGAAVANYTVAPVYTEGLHKGHHQWFVEWSREPSGGKRHFAGVLDAALQGVNSDYQAKRSGDIFLGRLELCTVEPGAFDRWLSVTGKLGGQRKVPRLSNDRRVAEGMERFVTARELPDD